MRSSPTGIRIGLRAAEMFEREGALWDLCSVQAFVIYQDGTLGSREQATRLADKTLGTAERLGHLGAAFMVLMDRIREAAILADLPLVEALGPQILDIGERGGLPWRYVAHLYLGLAAHWRGNAERARGGAAQCRRAGATGRGRRPERFAAGAAPGIPRTRRGGHRALRVDPVEVAQPRPGQRGRVVEQHARLRRGALPVWAVRARRRHCPRLSKGCSSSVEVDHLRRSAGGDPGWYRCRSGRRWDEAERYFAIAREVAERMSNRLELTDLRRLHARMLLDRGGTGDDARAAKMLEEALGRVPRLRHACCSRRKPNAYGVKRSA